MPKKTNRAKGLSKADRDLWDHVARSIDPIASNRFTGQEKDTIMVQNDIGGGAPSTNMVAGAAPSSPPSRRSLSADELTRAMTEWQNSGFSGDSSATETTPSRRQNVPGLDRRTAERLRKGKMEIDGRIDLHGLTRAEAHRQLRRFITAAQIRGLRCVLAITGKGSSRQKTEDAPFMGSERSGVLRDAVPSWLRAPDLQHLVIDIRSAQPKHGGSGALYVLLRRSRK